jgi:kynurenine formamidase
MGVKVIGSDILSPDKFIEHRDGVSCFDVHRVILGAGGVIAENLNNLESLLEVDEEYMVSLLPLKLDGCDGSQPRHGQWVVSVKATLLRFSIDNDMADFRECLDQTSYLARPC